MFYINFFVFFYRWEEVFNYYFDDGVCLMDKLIEKLLNVVEIVFDNCISYSFFFLLYEDFFVRFNFFLLDFNMNLGCSNYFGLVCMVKYW